MRLLGTALLLSLALITTGCSGDDPPPAPTAPPTRPDATSEPTPSGDPLTFSSAGGRTEIQCFPDGKRRFVIFDQVRTDRPVTLDHVTIGGDAMRLTGSWVAPLAKGAIPDGGAVDLDAGGIGMKDVEAWADRGPYDGATLEPRQRYTFFVGVVIRPDRTLDDITLGWDDGATSGSSTYDYQGRTRSGGC
jgi:hypothetical protein